MSQSIDMRKAGRAFARRQRGFTLIELIVATAILAILVGAAVPLARMPFIGSASTNCARTSG